MSGAHRYGLLDRALHRLAFAARMPQLGLADLESRLFRRELAAVPDEPPLFVTALPRAGTTILLEVLARTPTIATHIYRDLPFVLCPMLWSGVSGPFQRRDAPRERVHGDGIQISLDSPEAFEEMLWHAFFPQRYGAAVQPWTDSAHPEFAGFFAAHRRKIVALRRRRKPTARRYASKNNLNLCRIPVLLDSIEGAQVVVPFRDPLQHALSLLRQHETFLALHASDPFASRYMRGIGHFDFGAHLKPIDFGGWWQGRSVDEARGLPFWVDYWIHAYRHVLDLAGHPRLHLVSFEALGAGADLRPLAARLDLDPQALAAQAHVLKPARAHPVPDGALDGDLAREAQQLFAALRECCVLAGG